MESSKNNAQVIIAGKVLTLSGFESEEYLQQVAAYLNGKIDDCKKIEGFSRQTVELRSILISLNIADDYFKMKSRCDILEQEVEAREKESFDLKHDLISVQVDKEDINKKNEALKKELEDLQKKVIKLETELENRV